MRKGADGAIIFDVGIYDQTMIFNGHAVTDAHLRMNARMDEGATVGNFVEMKKIALGSQVEGDAPHLSW